MPIGRRALIDIATAVLEMAMLSSVWPRVLEAQIATVVSIGIGMRTHSQ